MSNKRNQEDYITYNTYADVLCEAALPLFNYGANEHANQLSMLSLFSGCGGILQMIFFPKHKNKQFI